MNDKYLKMSFFKGRTSPADNLNVVNRKGPVIEDILYLVVDSCCYLLSMCDSASLTRAKMKTAWDAHRFSNTKLRFPLTPYAWGDDGTHEFIGISCDKNNIFYSDFTLQANKPEYRLRLALNKQIIPNHLGNDFVVIEDITKVVSSLGCLQIYFSTEEDHSKAKAITNWFDTDLGKGLEVPFTLDSGKTLIFNDSVKTYNKNQLHCYSTFYDIEEVYSVTANIFSSLRIEVM